MTNLIVRNRPLNVLNDLDRMVDAFFGNPGLAFDRSLNRLPAIDVNEDDKQYTLVADIPGLSEKDVEIKIDDQLLTISNKQSEESESKKEGFVIRERYARSFSRSFTLPNDVNVDGISASSAEGVLTVVLPKTPKAQAKLIDVKRG